MESGSGLDGEQGVKLKGRVRDRVKVVVCLDSKSCPTLCDPMDYSPPGSSVHGDSPGKNTGWSGLPCLSPGDLPNPGLEPRPPTLQADSLLSDPPGKQRGWNKE